MSYVVYRGRVPGVYVHWEDCLKQVNMFKGNSYKGYKTMAEAEARWRNHLREERKTTFFGITTADEVYPRQCPCRRAFDLGSVLGTW
jgi:viroplasmin and RNaseH domain-containing protein